MSYSEHCRRAAAPGLLKAWARRLLPRGWLEKTYPLRERIRRAPFNLRARWRIFWDLRLRRLPIADLSRYEFRVSSQNAEDGIIAALFARLGVTNRTFVEFGVEDGIVCNTARLLRRGWSGLQMDPREGNAGGIKRELVTAENVNDLFARYGVPRDFDLLVIDIDGNDYWVWQAVSGYRPRVVVVEYNANLAPERSVAIRYDPGFRWDGTAYYGASLLALQRLGRRKGYRLAGCDSMGVNAFFVRADLAAGVILAPDDVREIYRPLGPAHRPSPEAPGKSWVEIA